MIWDVSSKNLRSDLSTLLEFASYSRRCINKKSSLRPLLSAFSSSVLIFYRRCFPSDRFSKREEKIASGEGKSQKAIKPGLPKGNRAFTVPSRHHTYFSWTPVTSHRTLIESRNEQSQPSRRHNAINMTERSRWEEMDRLGSSRSFIVFRDGPKSHMKPASKVLLVIACLSATVLFICFTTLSITKSRWNNKIDALRKKAWERSNESNILSHNSTKITMIDRKMDESTLQQIQRVKAFKFPEEGNNKIKFPEGEEEETDIYGDMVVSRQGKTMEASVQKQQKGKKHFFTPHHYSDVYPQLENYKNTHDFKSVQEVIGYVHKRPHLTVGPDGRPAVKFTGVYLKTPDDDFEDLKFNENPPNPSLNGQPYASDPLIHYKPSHPSEINNLATFSSDFDTGPRFSNKIVRPTTIPKDSATVPFQTQITQAIFHPFETLSTSRPDKRQKPLKILLDIYPVTPEVEHGQVYPHGRKTRYKQPSYHTTTVQPNSNRMIVHLNLYPKKSKQKRTQYFTSLVPGGGDLEERMFDGSGEIDDAYRTFQFQGEASRIDMGDVGYPTEEMNEPSFQEELTAVPVLNKQEEKATDVHEVRNEKVPEIMGDYVFEQEEMEDHEQQEERLLGMELEKMKLTNRTVISN